MSIATALIGVDWGSSNLRVFRMAEGGAVLGRRDDGRGASTLAPDRFADVLTEVASDWLDEDLPVVVCGMAGARGRWLEAPYAPCPAGLADLAGYVVRPADSPEVHILPGVAVWRDGMLDDVMRGEETQLFGLGGGFDRVIAPGTHSKWARMDGDRISDFRTHMTGEMFAAIGGAPSFLGGAAGTDREAFTAGVLAGLEDAPLGRSLFSARVGMLAGRVAPSGLQDYLSGLLIGAEISGEAREGLEGRIALLGAPALAERYRSALALAGLEDVVVADVEAATAAGLWRAWETMR
ncbi:2-dehydro-3-deoxygalactonokinase [Brevundimonas sp. FT23042]|uniref:2-dehydro-3-deoxygalactonokinase n=1 Tax=Brevundimonas sp. FT23042 TaxID=3393749 RepID=UPI003B588879